MSAAPLLVDTVYKDHIHAIRCALSVSAKAMGHVAAKWQRDYQAGYRVSSAGPDMSRAERFTQDCMTRLLLHRNLSREHWAVLVIRFAPPLQAQGRAVGDQSEVGEMEEAMRICLAHLTHPVSQEFTGWCLLRWSQRMPAGRGKWVEWEGKTSLSLRTLHRYSSENIYKPMVTLENAAIARAKDLLEQAALI